MATRRVRHLPFSSKALGAWGVYYSPAVTGLNNNDLASTWSDLSGGGNNLTSSGTIRPTYNTNVIAGFPAFQFGISASTRFTVATSVTTNAATCFTVWNKISNNGLARCRYSRVSLIWNTANTTSTGDYNNSNAIIFQAPSDQTVTPYNVNVTRLNTNANVSYTMGAWVSTWSRINGTAVNTNVNGAAASFTTSATSLNSNEFRIGCGSYTAAPTSDLNGYISAAILFQTAVSNSLAFRIQRALSMTFKIAQTGSA